MTIDDLEHLAVRHLRELGEDHPTTLASRNILASALCNAGRFDDAVILQKRIVATHLRRQGPSHPVTLLSAQKLEAMQRDASRVDEAVTEDS